MSGRPYWSTLRRDHARAVARTIDPGVGDQNFNLALAAICAVAALVLIAAGGHTIGFESIHGSGSHVSAGVLQALSTFGETAPAICLIALFAKRRPRLLWMSILASGYGVALTHVLKHLCDTARPAATLGDWVNVTGLLLKQHSFPSGHTMTAFLLAACFSVGARRSIRLLLYALAAMVGVSRVWVGAHWPIDVIVGAGIAGLSVGLAIGTLKFTPWGLGLAPHLAAVSVIAMSAVWELVMVPELPLARALEVAIAALSLSVLARDYLFEHHAGK